MKKKTEQPNNIKRKKHLSASCLSNYYGIFYFASLYYFLQKKGKNRKKK